MITAQSSYDYKPTQTDYCNLYGDIGYFPLLNDHTCQNYLYCFLDDSMEIRGILLKCLGSNLYNPARGKCVLRTEYTCRVFQNIRLDLNETTQLI